MNAKVSAKTKTKTFQNFNKNCPLVKESSIVGFRNMQEKLENFHSFPVRIVIHLGSLEAEALVPYFV